MRRANKTVLYGLKTKIRPTMTINKPYRINGIGLTFTYCRWLMASTIRAIPEMPMAKPNRNGKEAMMGLANNKIMAAATNCKIPMGRLKPDWLLALLCRKAVKRLMSPKKATKPAETLMKILNMCWGWNRLNSPMMMKIRLLSHVYLRN